MSENITINLEGLSKEEREQLLGLVEKANKVVSKKLWRPECGERYWIIEASGRVDWSVWTDQTVDWDRYSMGNCFRTKEEAEFAREKQKIKVELQRFADGHNDPEKLEWDGETSHHILIYSFLAQGIRGLSTSSYFYRSAGDLVYFTSAELAMEAAESVGKERILKYMFDIESEEEE